MAAPGWTARTFARRRPRIFKYKPILASAADITRAASFLGSPSRACKRTRPGYGRRGSSRTMSPELNTTLRPFCSYPDSACPRGSVCLRSSPDGSRRHTLRSTFFRATPIHIMTNIRIPAHALVLIADGTKARLLRNTGTALHVNFVTEQQLQQENPPTRDQGTDKPGRFLGGDRVSRSAVEQTDWHRLAEERFAARVAGVVGVADDIQVRLEIVDQRQRVTNSTTDTLKVTPREVRAKVEDALGRSTDLDASRIMIEANGSQVILRGTVRSWVRPQEAGVPSTWALLRKNGDRR